MKGSRQYDNQVLLRSERDRLKRLNRRLSRRHVGSQRWHTAREQLARFHARIANRRADYLHKMTREMASLYVVVGIEALNVAGLLKNHRLAWSLADASFGEIRRQLTCKSARLGGRVVTTDRFFPSSRLCSNPECHRINPDLDLEQREWTRPHCGRHHERDFNAAVNTAVEALRILSPSPAVAASGSMLVDRM